MRSIAVVVGFVGLFCSTLCHGQDVQDDACRITVEPELSKPPISRRDIYDFAIRENLFVCPYSPGQNLVLIQEACMPEAASVLGRYQVQRFSSVKINKIVSECSPLLGGPTLDYKPDDPVTSYLLVDHAEKFDPGVVRDKDHAFDWLFRQFLNDIAAPIIYYNEAGNVICLSARSSENFSLTDAIRDFPPSPDDAERAKFSIPETMTIETSPLSCREWVQRRFQYSLPHYYPFK